MKPKRDDTQSSSDRQKWQKVFDGLVGIINKQQSQLQNLVKERKLLEDRIRTQRRVYDSDVSLLSDRISQIKGSLEVKDMMRSIDAKKLELAVGMKQRDAFLQRLKLEEAELDLADFKERLDIVAAKIPNLEDETREDPPGRGSDQEPRDRDLEDEIEKLKNELDTLVSEKNSEVSALLAEKTFVWGQYKLLETNLCDKLKSKEAEARLAEEKILGLLASMEKLQSSNNDKDEAIGKLKRELADKEEIAQKRADELTRLANELDRVKRNRPTSELTPALSRCTTICSTASSIGNQDKGSRGLKRKDDTDSSRQVTPKLFSSSFKVPKLKTPAKQMR